MILLHLEVTLITVLLMSLFGWGLAVVSGNSEGAVRAGKAAAFLAATCLALAFPLGWLGWKDICLAVGLVLYACAVNWRSDTDLVIVFSGLGAVSFALWVLLYQMSAPRYEAGFGLAATDSLLLVICLLISRPKAEPAPAKPATLAAR